MTCSGQSTFEGNDVCQFLAEAVQSSYSTLQLSLFSVLQTRTPHVWWNHLVETGGPKSPREEKVLWKAFKPKMDFMGAKISFHVPTIEISSFVCYCSIIWLILANISFSNISLMKNKNCTK